MIGGQAILGVSWSSILVGTAVVSLRIYSRASRKALSRDDYTIGAALVVCLFGSIANTMQVVNGGGKHIDQVHPAQLTNWMKWTLVVIFQTTVATTLVKVSICLFLLRILGPTNKHLRHLVFVVLSCLLAINSAFIILVALECKPLIAVYDPAVKGTCFPRHVLLSAAIAVGSSSSLHRGKRKSKADQLKAYNVCTDLFCAGLPAFIIRDLSMDIRAKYALSVLMGLGVMTGACLIVRQATMSTLNHVDAIHDSVVTSIFAILEQNLGLILSCIPPLHSTLLTAAHKVMSRSKQLRSWLNISHTASAEESDQSNLKVKKSVRTPRAYYELQEVPTSR